MMKKLIGQKYFEIAVLMVVLVPQVAHTVYVFKVNSQYPDPWFAWAYALGVDLAILIFTVRGWIWTAVGYLLATLAHNLVYQFLPEKSDWGSVLIGTTLSVTIFCFSHLFYRHRKQRQHSADEEALIDLGKRVKSAQENGIQLEAQPYHCPCCGQTFPNSKKLNGHISGHKMKNEWKEEEYGDWKIKNQEYEAALIELKLNF